MPRISIRKLVLTSVLTLAATGFTLTAHAGASAQMLSDTCAGCHGIDGASAGAAIPTIAGLSSPYFIKVMQDYRSGEVPSTIMGRLARGYEDEDLEKMAAYFSAQRYAKVAQPFDAKLAETGKPLHDKYCSKCHKDAGTDPEDDNGFLGGQWKPYIRWTIEDYTSGNRQMSKNMKKKMKKLLARHGEQGIDALIEFYASSN